MTVRLLLVLVTLFLASYSKVVCAAQWKQLAASPKDLIGRELPPGMGGAWCYVPQLEGFLLYGGYSPRLSNEGWLFDPAKGEIKLLWPDDSLGYDGKAGGPPGFWVGRGATRGCACRRIELAR